MRSFRLPASTTETAFPDRCSLAFTGNAVSAVGLPERALEGLVDVAVRQGFQRFGPVAHDGTALGGGARAAIPADLLHVVIELDAVAVRVERECRIVDAGIELGRDVDKGAARGFEEIPGGAQLCV